MMTRGPPRSPRAERLGLRPPDDLPRSTPVLPGQPTSTHPQILPQAEHLRRVLARRRGDRDPAQHARDLFNAGLLVEDRDATLRAAAFRALGHRPLFAGLGGDLRKMRDAQNLALFSKGSQFLSHYFGYRSANAGVDFVEDQGRHGGGPARYHFNLEADAGLLPS